MHLVVGIYFATVFVVFTVGFAADDVAQTISSLVLLGVLVLIVQRIGLDVRKAEPPTHIFARHLIIFVIAMVGRYLFIAFFKNPFEKTPILYLTLLTALWVEGRTLRSLGVSGSRWGRNVLAGLLLGVVCYYLIQVIYISGARLMGDSSATFASTSYDAVGVLRIVVSSFLLSSLSEEMLFRGYLQGGVRNVIGSGNALVYSAVLFGLWHTVWGIPFIDEPVFAAVYAASYMLFAGLFGIVVGVAYRSTGSLILPIFIHGLWNTFASLTPVSTKTSALFTGDPWRPFSFGLMVLLFYLLIPRVARFMKVEEG